jgi:hypothetical protein
MKIYPNPGEKKANWGYLGGTLRPCLKAIGFA